MKDLLLWLAKLTGAIPAMLFFKRRTVYADRRSQSRRIKGAAVIVSNHTSIFDYMVMLYLFPWRTLHYLTAELMFFNKALAWLMSCLGAVRVDRKSGEMSFIGEAVSLLKRGRVVGIFPEAYVSRDGKIGEFKPSAAYIALKSGAPVIPVYCSGGYGLFKRVDTAIGERIYLRDYCPADDPTPEELGRLSAMLRDRVRELERQVAAAKKTRVRGMRPRWFPYDLLRVTIWPSVKLCFPPRFHYEDSSVKGRRVSRGALVATNHQSFFDPILVTHTFFSRRVFFIAAEILFRQNRWLKWFMELIGAIPIDRYAPMDIKCFNRVVDTLRAGGLVCSFPEGHISGEGDVFKPGTILMAMKAGAPIIPVVICDEPRFFKRVDIVIGKPFYPGDRYDINHISVGDAEAMAGELRRRMLDLKREFNDQNRG